jgi:hypothetical protein
LSDTTSKDETRVLPPTTAGIDPQSFAPDFAFLNGKWTVAVILAVMIFVGFALRVHDLGAESLSEDELNKLETVEDYRQNGLTSKNGEHPFLMKGLQTVSLVAADKINANVLSAGDAISPEFALRFPLVLFGTFTTLIIFLLVRELFGSSIALVSACLWAVEPVAIAFDRVAKEDSLVLFFFLLTCFFWVRSQTGAELDEPKWTRWVSLAGVAFAAAMASKYNPWLLAPLAAYHGIYDRMQRKWYIARPQFLKFFVIMGVAFVVLNPTILMPQTWHEMLKFSSEGRIAHDSYDFMGQLYPNKMTLWFRGVPWTFYLVFLGIKYSLPTLVLFIVGIPLLVRRRMGDGRFLLLWWVLFTLVPFSLVGGKFTRYFAIDAPVVLISAGVAFCFGVLWLSRKLRLAGVGAVAFQGVLFAALLAVPLYDSLSITPHFRLFTNTVGGGMGNVGYYFPHDEFYDAGSREVVTAIARQSPGHALIACEAPHLLDYYADRIGVPALDTVSLSDPAEVQKLKEGDFIVITSGRRYFSNYGYEQALAKDQADAEVTIDGAIFAKIYKLDTEKLAAIRTIAVGD